MELRVPVEVVILRLLSDGEIANPVRMNYRIEKEHSQDLSESFEYDGWQVDYIQQRLSRLESLDLLEKVPPETSGLYRITDLGRAVLLNYLETGDPEFDYTDMVEKAKDVDRREVGQRELPWFDG